MDRGAWQVAGSWGHKESDTTEWLSMKAEIKLPTYTGSQKKQENTRDTSTSVLSPMLKPLTVWKILQEDGIRDHLTCFLRNLYAGQGATVKTRHGTTNWFQIGKGVYQGCILSVQFSCSVMSNSLRPHGLQHARPPCPSPTPKVYSNSCPSSWWCHPAILSSESPSPPTFSLSQHQSLFKWVSSSHQVAKVLEFQIQH